jgi:hypothetical protein
MSGTTRVSHRSPTFLSVFPDICPHDLFGESSRASQLAEFHKPQSPYRGRERELRDPHRRACCACTVGDNRLRHESTTALHARQRQRDGRGGDTDLADGRPTSMRLRWSTAFACFRLKVTPRASLPATSISFRYATAPCTFSTTSPTRARTNRSRNSRSMH